MTNMFSEFKDMLQAASAIFEIFDVPERWDIEKIKTDAIEILENPNSGETAKQSALLFAGILKEAVKGMAEHLPEDGEPRAKAITATGKEIK